MLAYLNDLESDLSVFHQINDMYRMDTARFFRLAPRLGAYDGVVRIRMAQQRAADQAQADRWTAQYPDAVVEMVESAPETLLGHEAFTAAGRFGPLIEYGRADG